MIIISQLRVAINSGKLPIKRIQVWNKKSINVDLSFRNQEQLRRYTNTPILIYRYRMVPNSKEYDSKSNFERKLR